MHQRSLSELQVVSTGQEASTQWTTEDRASRSSRLSRGSMRGCLCPPRGTPLWAWLLLGALVVPGAWSFLSEDQEEMLVELHNHYRGLVSPSATAMLPLKWDTGLKLIAEGYATKCIWNHNPELEDTGENLFAGTGALDLREALEKWFLEHLDYDYHNNTCDEDKMCGHYTQMVWADTHRVGCAFHLCNTMEGLEWERVSFLVCNYFPAGNFEGERPYVEGDWCSSCPEKHKCENNLCVADTDGDGDDGDGDFEEEEEDKEEGTVIPPPATSESSPQEDSEDEKIVSPSITTDVQPESTSTSARESEDTLLRITSTQGTPTPGGHSTTPGEEQKGGEKMEEKVELEEEKKETMRETAAEREKDIARKIKQNTRIIASAGSVSSPSLVLASLTGILTLRL
ncbi:peptidase inhibitor 16-like [Toxotes jaculatrix]|uniref:peptidase inhibitor 16-like n=1 Tax=Toxotes jaculatrix TaxID=941984 RepID=UPI001B3AACEF|nr:peptidase inhibitor 16-like [Toxotes jaculatrix]